MCSSTHQVHVLPAVAALLQLALVSGPASAVYASVWGPPLSIAASVMLLKCTPTSLLRHLLLLCCAAGCNLQDELFASFEQIVALADKRGEPYAR